MSVGSRDGGPPSRSVVNAGSVLRPPRDHMQHLRGGELTAQTLEPGELSARDGRITALERDEIAEVTIDAAGCAVLPGFVDCHTHLPFAGWRWGEYEQKLTGVPYEEIARGGGGIKSSARRRGARPGVVAGRGDARCRDDDV